MAARCSGPCQARWRSLQRRASSSDVSAGRCRRSATSSTIPAQTTCAVANVVGLADTAKLRAAVLCVSAFAGTGVGRKLRAEAHGLQLRAVATRGNHGFAHGKGAALAEAAIVLGSAAFIGETG